MIGIYSIFDKKALSYSAPFFVPNELVAMRSVGSAVADKSSLLGQYPEDYDLYEVGSWDDQAGAVIPKGPKFLINCATMKRIQDEVAENAS